MKGQNRQNKLMETENPVKLGKNQCKVKRRRWMKVDVTESRSRLSHAPDCDAISLSTTIGCSSIRNATQNNGCAQNKNFEESESGPTTTQCFIFRPTATTKQTHNNKKKSRNAKLGGVPANFGAIFSVRKATVGASTEIGEIFPHGLISWSSGANELQWHLKWKLCFYFPSGGVKCDHSPAMALKSLEHRRSITIHHRMLDLWFLRLYWSIQPKK